MLFSSSSTVLAAAPFLADVVRSATSLSVSQGPLKPNEVIYDIIPVASLLSLDDYATPVHKAVFLNDASLILQFKVEQNEVFYPEEKFINRSI